MGTKLGSSRDFADVNSETLFPSTPGQHLNISLSYSAYQVYIIYKFALASLQYCSPTGT